MAIVCCFEPSFLCTFFSLEKTTLKFQNLTGVSNTRSFNERKDEFLQLKVERVLEVKRISPNNNSQS